MNWYKYRECSSSGYSDWNYIHIDPKTIKSYGSVGAYLKENVSVNNWSEHYRGLEYFRIKNPPRTFLKRQIASAKNMANYWKEEAKILQAELDNIPKSYGEAEIIIHTMAGNGVYEVWATITQNDEQIYKSRSHENRNKVRDIARNWCKKKNLDVIRISYLTPTIK